MGLCPTARSYSTGSYRIHVFGVDNHSVGVNRHATEKNGARCIVLMNSWDLPGAFWSFSKCNITISHLPADPSLVTSIIVCLCVSYRIFLRSSQCTEYPNSIQNFGLTHIYTDHSTRFACYRASKYAVVQKAHIYAACIVQRWLLGRTTDVHVHERQTVYRVYQIIVNIIIHV